MSWYAQPPQMMISGSQLLLDERGSKTEPPVQGYVRKSSGVIRSENGADWDIRVDHLEGEWEKEFGTERSRVLKGMVEGEMADYWFLWERRAVF